MRFWEIPSSPPAEYLAWDEVLLEETETTGDELLWFWESEETFVVVGYGQDIEREVDVAACTRKGVPILRRCSGGGAVVVGPGCLSYGLTLAIRQESVGEYATVTGANRSIMSRNCRALRRVLGPDVHVMGYTDLALNSRKFSGNAQRRRQHSLLFHGTFLRDFDSRPVEKLLRFPSRSPEYRAGRSHGDFMMNCSVEVSLLKSILREEWNAREPLHEPPLTRMRVAFAAKYGNRDWTWRRSK